MVQTIASAPNNVDTALELQRVQQRVRELEAKCGSLQRELEKVDEQRRLYLRELYRRERESREFEDVDIPMLEAMSAGPVERIQ